MKDEESEVTINFNDKDYVPWVNLGKDFDDLFLGWYGNTWNTMDKIHTSTIVVSLYSP